MKDAHTLTELQMHLVDLHVLYQLQRGNADGGEPFIAWMWTYIRSTEKPDPMGEAIDLITEQHAPNGEDLAIAQAQRVTWELAVKVKAAVSVVRSMAQPIIVGGAS